MFTCSGRNGNKKKISKQTSEEEKGVDYYEKEVHDEWIHPGEIKRISKSGTTEGSASGTTEYGTLILSDSVLNNELVGRFIHHIMKNVSVQTYEVSGVMGYSFNF